MKGCHGNAEDLEDKLLEVVETVTDFSYLGNRIKSGGGCDAVATSRTRLEWLKFRDSLNLLHGKKFPLKIKGGVHKSCMRSAMHYGSETWCLAQNEFGLDKELKDLW